MINAFVILEQQEFVILEFECLDLFRYVKYNMGNDNK